MLLDALSIPATASTCGQQAVHIASTWVSCGTSSSQIAELMGYVRLSANEIFAFGIMCFEFRKIPEKSRGPLGILM
jgi:hypothetical protein